MKDLCTFLEWDTQFFGRRIACYTLPTVNPAQMQELENWCSWQAIACLYLPIDAAATASVHLAELHNFRLMEVRLFMEARLEPDAPIPVDCPEGVVIRRSVLEDSEALISIAAGSYPYTRYSTDPQFSPQAGAYYSLWVDKSLYPPTNLHLCAEKDGQVVGFICGSPAEKGQPAARSTRQASSASQPALEEVFELIAVDPNARLGGVGRALLQAGMEWCRQHGRLRISFATQAPNVPLQRAVQRLGFITTGCQYYFHRWFR